MKFPAAAILLMLILSQNSAAQTTSYHVGQTILLDLTDAQTQIPLKNLRVDVIEYGHTNPLIRINPDDSGHAEFKLNDEGTYNIIIAGEGYAQKRILIEVTGDDTTQKTADEKTPDNTQAMPTTFVAPPHFIFELTTTTTTTLGEPAVIGAAVAKDEGERERMRQAAERMRYQSDLGLILEWITQLFI